MKKITFSLIFGLIFIFSCTKDEDVTLSNYKSYNYQGINFSFSKNDIFISRESNFYGKNINGVFLDKDIELKNGRLISKQGNKIWFVPFEEYKKPIEIMNMAGPKIIISCDPGSCEPLQGLACDVEESSDGNGNTVFTCTLDCCKMIVIVTGDEQKRFSNGIFITGQKLIYNN